MDLYGINLAGIETVKMCGGNTGTQTDDDQESCVTATAIPGVDGALALGDTKHPGLQLRFTAAELDAFTLRYARERGLTL